MSVQKIYNLDIMFRYLEMNNTKHVFYFQVHIQIVGLFFMGSYGQYVRKFVQITIEKNKNR